MEGAVGRGVVTGTRGGALDALVFGGALLGLALAIFG